MNGTPPDSQASQGGGGGPPKGQLERLTESLVKLNEQIKWQYVLVGAIVFLIGIAVPVFIQLFLPGNLRVPVSGSSVLIAFVVSCSTGLFFGYLPANQAASLQPVESLRYE